MAGDWIVWTKGLTKRIEVVQIADHMGISRYEAACHCMAVWEWADENTTDGDAPCVTPSALSELIGVPGIAEAMEKVGWLVVDNGGVIFPNWTRWNTESAKQRLQHRDRQRGYRKRVRDDRSETPQPQA